MGTLQGSNSIFTSFSLGVSFAKRSKQEVKKMFPVIKSLKKMSVYPFTLIICEQAPRLLNFFH